MRTADSLALSRVPSPLGELFLVTQGERLCALDFDDCAARLRAFLGRRYADESVALTANPGVNGTVVAAYFDGDLGAVLRAEIAWRATPFQRTVWQALRRIPAGSTLTYGGLAQQINNPRAQRAVGHANGANPCAIVIPCHRLVGADGSLTGYAGGLRRKRWLLDHERANT
jgi:methylated-DNA-[protein]-cysteine S-methyltransferase